jgi:hypothetical protein
MALTFAGNIKWAAHLRELAVMVNSKDVIKRRHIDVFANKAEELLAVDDIKAVVAFVKRCEHRDLNVRIIELYIKKHGAHDMDIMYQIINVIQHWARMEFQKIIEDLFSQTPQAFHIASDIDDLELERTIRTFSNVCRMLVQMYNKHDLLPENVKKEFMATTALLCDIVARKVQNGSDPRKFFAQAVTIVPLLTDMILTTLLMENVAFADVRGCLALLNVEEKSRDHEARSALKAVRDVYVTRAVQENAKLTFDEICIIAANTFDLSNDGISTAIDEEFVITEGLPLCTSDDDVLRLCRSFGTKSGTNRCISTFLAQCEELDRWMLEKLAMSVPASHDFGGVKVREDLIDAKKRFGLAIDLEKILSRKREYERHFFSCFDTCR